MLPDPGIIGELVNELEVGNNGEVEVEVEREVVGELVGEELVAETDGDVVGGVAVGDVAVGSVADVLEDAGEVEPPNTQTSVGPSGICAKRIRILKVNAKENLHLVQSKS